MKSYNDHYSAAFSRALVGWHHQSLLGRGSRHCYGINYTTEFPAPPEIAHSGPFGSDFFHHTQPVTPVIDTHLTLRNNEDLIRAARCVSVSLRPLKLPQAMFSAH